MSDNNCFGIKYSKRIYHCSTCTKKEACRAKFLSSKLDKTKHTLVGKASTRDVWLDGKALDPKRSREVWDHSPNGFNWGYTGSGPAQLALAVLLEITDEQTAVRMHQRFKENFIAGLPMAKNFKAEFTWPEK